MKPAPHLTLLLTILCLILSGNMSAEKFSPRRASLEKEGQKIEITELNKFPSFQADYRPEENIVIIQCSAGRLVLKKGIFFYGYSGIHKGLRITARAYVENGKLEQIVYEEYDEYNNVTASISYFKE